MSLLIPFVFVAGVAGLLGNAPRALTSTGQDVAIEKPPIALQRIGDSSVALFDEALGGRWAEISAELRGIDQRLSELPSELPYPDVVDEMRARIGSLHEGVTARRTSAVLDDANAITRLVLQISDGFEVTVPFDIAILPYYGRQLQVGVMSGRLDLLRRATQDLRAAWTNAELRVTERGDTAAARRFTDIVVDLEAAHQVSDFEPLAKAERAAAASLVQAFQSGG